MAFLGAFKAAQPIFPPSQHCTLLLALLLSGLLKSNKIHMMSSGAGTFLCLALLPSCASGVKPAPPLPDHNVWPWNKTALKDTSTGWGVWVYFYKRPRVQSKPCSRPPAPPQSLLGSSSLWRGEPGPHTRGGIAVALCSVFFLLPLSPSSLFQELLKIRL